MKANLDRFTELPLRQRLPEVEYRGDLEAERRERKLDDDRHRLQYYFRRGEWWEWATIAMAMNNTCEELERLELITPKEKGRWGRGFTAGRKLFQ